MRFSSAYILSLIFVSCQSHYVLESSPKVSYIDYSNSKPDSALTATINPYKTKVDAEMNELVCEIEEDIEKAPGKVGLGNFVSDLVFDSYVYSGPSGTDNKFNPDNTFCLLNNGGLRASLQKGKLTKRNIYELIPFENEIVIVKMKGVYITSLLTNYLLSKKGQPVSHNILVTYKENKLVNFSINNRGIDSVNYIYIITSDYLANGGDNMDFFKKGEILTDGYEKVKLRDCVINKLHSMYFAAYPINEKRKVIRADTRPRIYFE